MNLLIVHLSDIHIAFDTDPVLQRPTAIVAALRPLLKESSACAIVVTGDLAFSGQESEYLLAIDLLVGIRSAILAESPTLQLHYCMIPGNHDCDLGSAHPARDRMRDSILREAPTVIDTDTAEICVQPQRAFFAFRDTLGMTSTAASDCLSSSVTFPVGKHRVLFRALNTAWLSRLHEQPGTLHFPPDAITGSTAGCALVITVLHHPYNWFTPDNGRAIRSRIEEASDIILTGHEHDFSLRSLRGGRGETNLYVEGAALQMSSDKGTSAFNAMLVDLDGKRQVVHHLEWDGEMYSLRGREPSWSAYQVSALRDGLAFRIADDFARDLDDLGIALTHHRRGSVRLSDIFVYPDLRPVAYRGTDSEALLRGEALLAESGGTARILITGPDHCGKSCFAKRLFREAHDAGLVPILLDAAVLRAEGPERLLKDVQRAFATQYGPGWEKYTQLPEQQRCLLVDNYHRLRGGKKQILGFVHDLARMAGRVMLFAHDISEHAMAIVGASTGLEDGREYRHYKILPFGRARRDELAEKWFRLDDYLDGDPESLARQLIAAERITNTAIGRNFVPSFPLFLLPILQAQVVQEPVDLNASTYGYFYELLIRRSLAAKGTREALDIKLAYLSHWAYRLFKGGGGMAPLPEGDLRTIHQAFEEERLLSLHYPKLIEELLAAEVITETEDGIGFRYPYIYYYFLAAYLRDHITEANVQTVIASLARGLSDEASANTLLFLVHLSKNPFIIENIVEAGRRVFGSVEPAELRREQLEAVLPGPADRVVCDDVEPRATRKELLQQLDDGTDAERRAGMQDSMDATAQLLSEINVAFRSMQLLGQILKNFPGSLDGDTKRRLAGECYRIGLRTLGTLLGIVRTSRGELLADIVRRMKEEEPALSDEVLWRRAGESIFGLLRLCVFGIVKRIAIEVGTPALGQVYRLLREEWDVPAVALIDVALKLDQDVSFPDVELIAVGEDLEDNDLPAAVLRSLVVSHFHLFPVKVEVRQSMCAKLGIAFRSVQGLDSGRQLLPSTRAR